MSVLVGTDQLHTDLAIFRDVARHSDERGWLCELFRVDMTPLPAMPMAYVSATLPGVVRGPHEHREQTDCFYFLGPSIFRLHLWENRPGRDKRTQVVEVGAHHPMQVFIPPGVVHAYQNIGNEVGLVLNFPDKLYGGWLRSAAVDEIRHENDLRTTFQVNYLNT